MRDLDQVTIEKTWPTLYEQEFQRAKESIGKKILDFQLLPERFLIFQKFEFSDIFSRFLGSLESVQYTFEKKN